jgi:hypothetical protein
MPGHVAKGEILRKLDQVLNDAQKRAQFLARIRAKRPDGSWNEELVEVASNMLPLTPAEKKHLVGHWFDEYGGWWPRQQPTDIVLRLGLIQAIGLATRTPPAARFDCYWVCGVDAFELVSCVAPGQVTLLIFTPNAPVSDQLPEDFAHSTQREEIYTVRHRSRGPGEFQVQPDEEFCEFVQPLIARS